MIIFEYVQCNRSIESFTYIIWQLSELSGDVPIFTILAAMVGVLTSLHTRAMLLFTSMRQEMGHGMNNEGSWDEWFAKIDMDVSKNRGTPKWMVYNGKPYLNGWFGGTPIFRNPIYFDIVSNSEMIIIDPRLCKRGSLTFGECSQCAWTRQYEFTSSS